MTGRDDSLKQGIWSSHFCRDLSQVVRCTPWDTPVPFYTRTSPLPRICESICGPSKFWGLSDCFRNFFQKVPAVLGVWLIDASAPTPGHDYQDSFAIPPTILQGPQARIPQDCCGDCRETWGAGGTAAEIAPSLEEQRNGTFWQSLQQFPQHSPPLPSFPGSFPGSLRSSFGEFGLGGP